MIIRVESEGERTELSSNKEPFQLQDEQGHMNLVAGLVYIHMNFLFMLLPGVPVLSFLVRSALE